MRRHFDGTVTLYYPYGDGYKRRTVEGAFIRLVRNVDEGTNATVYLPIHVPRALRYVDPEKFKDELSTFTVYTGIIAVLGKSTLPYPTGSAFTVSTVEKRFVGSRRMHHLKLRMIIKQIFEEDDSIENSEY